MSSDISKPPKSDKLGLPHTKFRRRLHVQVYPVFPFAQVLFDSKDLARKAAMILKAMLEAQSPRLSEIAQKMPGTPDANYKQIQRFLRKVGPKSILLRLFQTDAPFVLGDPTEIPRPEAWHTPYVGTLSDGKTKAFGC